MPKKGNNASKRKVVQNLAKATGTSVTAKPDVPEPDAAFVQPILPPTPFENALKAFDPASDREFGRKMRDAGTTATRIADRVEEVRQLGRQIDAIEHKHLPPEKKIAAQKIATDQLVGLEKAATKATHDRAAMDEQFIAGWAKAKDLKAPPPHTMVGANDTAKRLKAKATLRENQEKALAGASTAAEAIAAAWKPVDEAAGKIQAALADLKQTIATALKQQAEAAASEQRRRELIIEAKAAVLLAEHSIASKLIANANAAKLPVDPQMATLATASAVAVKAEKWQEALDDARESLRLAKALQRAIAKAGAAETTYNDELARISGLLVTLRADLTRLKIKLEGPFAELKTFETAAKAAALKKNWADALEALSNLEDRIEQGQKIVPGFDRYLTGTPPMLLQATFDKVVALNSLKTNKDILDKLKEVYEEQCNAVADAWRAHLGYVPPFKGPPQNHYSTFYDSIVADRVTVLKQDSDTVSDELFSGANWLARIHATYQFGGVNHHKYWGGFYSGGLQIGVEGGLDEQHPEIRQGLDATYATMVNAMYARIETAIERHGRIGAAVGGPVVS